MDTHLQKLTGNIVTLNDGRCGVVGFQRIPLKHKSSVKGHGHDGHAVIFDPDTKMDVLCINTSRTPEIIIAVEIENTDQMKIEAIKEDKELIDKLSRKFVYNPHDDTHSPLDISEVLDQNGREKSHFQPLLENFGHFFGIYRDKHDGRLFLLVYSGITNAMDKELDHLYDDTNMTVGEFVDSPTYQRALYFCRKLACKIAFETAVLMKIQIPVEQDTDGHISSAQHTHSFIASPSYEEWVNTFERDSSGRVHYFNMCSKHDRTTSAHLNVENPHKQILIAKRVNYKSSLADNEMSVYPSFRQHPDRYNSKISKKAASDQPVTVVYPHKKNLFDQASIQPVELSHDSGWIHYQLEPRVIVMRREPKKVVRQQ
jgi:hypothetical protein